MLESDFGCCTGENPSFLWQCLIHPKVENCVWGKRKQKVKVCDVPFLNSFNMKKNQKQTKQNKKLLKRRLNLWSHCFCTLPIMSLLWQTPETFCSFHVQTSSWLGLCLMRMSYNGTWIIPCINPASHLRSSQPFCSTICWGMSILQMGHCGKCVWVTGALMLFVIHKY